MGTMTGALERGFNPAPGRSACGQYLMFWLGREEFAIQVLRVREIMGVREINTVPQTPSIAFCRFRKPPVWDRCERLLWRVS